MPIYRKRKRSYVPNKKRFKRKYNTSRKYNRRRYNRSGTGVTPQFDQKLQYVAKRGYSKFQRRKATNFRSMLFKQIGTKTIVRNNSVTVTAVPAAQQWAAIHLYGVAGDPTATVQEVGVNDVHLIKANDIGFTETAKINFTSAILDATIRNNGTDDAELDVYELLTRTDNKPFLSFAAAITNVELDTPSIGTATALTFTTRGVTPFEFPALMQYVKVLSKKKYFLKSLDAFTYQLKDTKIRTITGDDVGVANTNFAKNYWTKTLLVVGKSVTGSADTMSMTVGATRVYRYKVLSEEAGEDGVL